MGEDAEPIDAPDFTPGRTSPMFKLGETEIGEHMPLPGVTGMSGSCFLTTAGSLRDAAPEG